VFAFWKPRNFGGYRPAKEGGEICYRLGKGEPGREVVPTSNGSQIIRSQEKELEVT
jgi:hypothetical protein